MVLFRGSDFGYNTTDNTPKPKLVYPMGSGPVNNIERNAGHAGPNTPNSKASTGGILDEIFNALQGLIKDIFVPDSNQDRASASPRQTDPLMLNSQLTPPANYQFNIPNDPELRRSVKYNDEFGDVKFVAIARNPRSVTGQGGGIDLGSSIGRLYRQQNVFADKGKLAPPIRRSPSDSVSGSSIIATAQSGAGGGASAPSTPAGGTAPAGGGSTPSSPSSPTSPSAPAPSSPSSPTYAPAPVTSSSSGSHGLKTSIY